MSNIYKYKQSNGSWPIIIDIQMSLNILDKINSDIIEIDADLYLLIDTHIVSYIKPQEIEWIIIGIKLVKNQILLSKQKILITIHNILFDEAYYQEEALVCAIIGWFKEYLNITPPNIDIEFDNESQRYIYHFPSLNSPH